MNCSDAQRVMEALRKGIPPDGYVCQFTVGRKSEIDILNERLCLQKSGALLLRANYGSGKTHLLRYIKEKALEEGFIISAVTLDAKSAVRFNRMDQVLGAVCRGIEVPGAPDNKGIRVFCNEICGCIEEGRREKIEFWRELTNNWKWDLSSVLESPAMFVAIRAWSTEIGTVHDLVEDWFCQPWNYRAQRRNLYEKLVSRLRSHFRDPRPDWKFYNDGLFDFHSQGYSQSWAALRDLHRLSVEAGYKGFIILFDEFEDVIYNINKVNLQEAAFWNLFEFYMGSEYQGMTYFAVTPDFVRKCKVLLQKKGRWDYDYTIFDKLQTFEMSPLTSDELQELAMKILEVHGVAYQWEPDLVMKISELRNIVKKAASVQVEDRARHTIKEIVKYLDERVDQ